MSDNGKFLAIWGTCVALILGFLLFYGSAQGRTGDPVYEGYNLFPALSGASPTAQGQGQYDTTTNTFRLGDGTNTRVILPADPIRVMIPSPQSMPLPGAIYIPPAKTGYTFVITKATFFSTNSGTTMELCTTNGSNWTPSSATEIFSDVSPAYSGVSDYQASFTSGTTNIPSESALMLKWGGGSSADYAGFTLEGYWRKD